MSKSVLLLNKKHCMREDLTVAIKQVRAEGYDLDISIPWDINDIGKLFDDAMEKGASRILTAGGDGSLNGITNLILDRGAEREVALALLPLGTANDFARGVGIPSNDLTSALRLAVSGGEHLIDVGVVNDRHFVNVASGGIGAEITSTTPVELKRLLGGAAYSIMGLIKATQLQPYSARISLPDGQTEDGEVLVITIGNSKYAGGGFEVAPKASLTDGLLDLAVVTKPENEGFDQLVEELNDPFNEDNRSLHYRQLAEFVIETKQPLPLNLDGEPMLETRFEFGIKPKILRMVLQNVF
ncbi:lipid kinase YegS [Labrenzia sp. PHM005]|uniref:lipid kinase YegS n=1 Tax=Labrenzia sp. PHM005 TaxID=2590016 RepID=UPI00113FDE18|nr:lipid kinase YegS [Labrenzia sp. PHM005]QDG78731.1 lipid kinase YegS [Labrenzia sp. PHM005]